MESAERSIAPAPEWEAFGMRLRELRRARGFTQKGLAELLGVAPSWVSQVEAAQLVPGLERVEALAQLLGGDLRTLAGVEHAGDVEAAAAGFACLWRARADLLARAAHVAPTRPQRMRLNRLSRQLLEGASLHPTAQEFVKGGRLLSLAEIAEQVPPEVRQLVAAELAVMKLDAPVETGVERKKVLDGFDLLLEDLGEERVEAVAGALTETSLSPVRERPHWQQLACVGGPLGTAQAQVVDGASWTLLLGHDPVGWFGFDFVAGQWLVRPAGARENASIDPGERARSSGLVSPMGHAALGATVGSRLGMGVGMLAGSALMGPVLGAVVGGAIGGLAGGIVRGVGDPRAVSSSKADVDTDWSDQPERTLALCEAFGRHWVRVETTKLLGLYLAYGTEGVANGMGSLPGRQDSVAYLMATAEAAEEAQNREADESGTRDFAKVERLRELADIHDSLTATAQALA